MQKVIALVCLLAFGAVDAEAKPPPLKPMRVQFVRIVDAATMPRGEVIAVARETARRYRRLKLPFKFTGVRQMRVGFGPGPVSGRFDYARRVANRVRAKTRGFRTHVFVPMTTDGYSWGLAYSGMRVSVGTATSYNLRRERRYWHSITTAVHELGHLLGLSHDDDSANVMHSNALAYVNNNVPPFPWWFRDMAIGFGWDAEICDYTLVPCLTERVKVTCQSKSQ